MDITIEALNEALTRACMPELVGLLQDAVVGGASVGFLLPVSREEAVAYWESVVAALAEGSRVLLIARRPDGAVVGTVQLDLAMRANGRHRAEVSKLMVHSSARRQGIGRALMLALEEQARRLGRTTLVLDTRQGDPSERLYRSLGYQFAGAIPRYARSADGTLHTTAFYYRLLET